MTARPLYLILVTVIVATWGYAPQAHAKKPKTVEIKSEPPASVIPAKTDSKLKDIKYVMTSNAGDQVFEETTLLKSRVLTTAESTDELKSVSYGLRKKAIFGLVPVRVYVLQLFAAHPEKLVKTDLGFMASLKEAGPVQIHMNFLRNLPGHKISESFKEGLEANKINFHHLSEELSRVLSEVSAISEFKKGQAFSITAVWKNDEAALLLEDSQKIVVIPGGPEFIEQIFSIWFGKPADSKLAELKKDLLK